MIKLGTQNISALRLGGQEIKKAYLGETLMFSGKKPSRLPDGYREVEYIHSDENCSIDTGVKGVNYAATRIVMDIEPDVFGGSNEYIFGKSGLGYPSTTTMYWFNLWRYSATQIRYRYYTYTATTRDANISKNRLTIDFDLRNKKLIIGGNQFSLTSNNFNTTTLSNESHIFLLSFSASNKSISGKLYSAQIYFNGSTLTRDFVPCINPSGLVGLYDLVGSKFYGNAGTGTLTAGPAV